MKRQRKRAKWKANKKKRLAKEAAELPDFHQRQPCKPVLCGDSCGAFSCPAVRLGQTAGCEPNFAASELSKIGGADIALHTQTQTQRGGVRKLAFARLVLIAAIMRFARQHDADGPMAWPRAT